VGLAALDRARDFREAELELVFVLDSNIGPVVVRYLMPPTENQVREVAVEAFLEALVVFEAPLAG